MDGPLRTLLSRLRFDGGEQVADASIPYGWLVAQGLAPGERLYLVGYAIIFGGAWGIAMPGDHGDVYPWPTTGQTFRLVSDSADDAAGGDGARVVRLHYLDDDYGEHYEDVTLDGLTMVDSVETAGWRLNAAEVISCGDKGCNVGIIRVYASDGTSILGEMSANEGTLQQIVQTVPSGKVDVFRVGNFGCSITPATYHGRLMLFSRSSPAYSFVLQEYHVNTVYATSRVAQPTTFALPAGTDYYGRFAQTRSGTSHVLSASIDGIRVLA